MVIQSYSSQGSEVPNVQRNSSAQDETMDGDKEAEAVSEKELLGDSEECQVIRAVTPTVRVAFAASPGHSRPASRASATDLNRDFGELSRASSGASERKAVGASQ